MAPTSDGSMTEIERGDGVAAWRQIADQIEADIGRGVIAPGEQLSTEATLAQRFAVNRHTVRRALAALAGKGLIRATAGRGTFVEGKPIPYLIGSRTRFSEIVSKAGREAGGVLLESAEAVAEADVARALGLRPGAPIVRLDTLRSANGVPITLGKGYFPLPRFSGIGEAYRRTRSVTGALRVCGVIDYRRAETRISARLATSEETTHLDLAPGRLVLTVNSTNVDSEGVPVQFTRALFAADRAELVIES